MVGLSSTNNDLQGLANHQCNCNMQELACKINRHCQTVSADINPLPILLHPTAQDTVLDSYIISEDSVES